MSLRRVYDRKNGLLLSLPGSTSGPAKTVPGSARWAKYSVGHLQAEFRQFHDLPCHLSLGIDALPRVSTGAVSGEWQGDDRIDMLRHLDGLADMTTLRARRPSGLRARGLGFPRVVSTGWLTGDRAVLHLPFLEGQELSEKLSHLRFEPADPCLETLTFRTRDFADVLLEEGDRVTPLSTYLPT
jgi:hypothetical protein